MAGRSVLGFKSIDNLTLLNGLNVSSESEVPYMDLVTYHIFWTGDAPFIALLTVEGTLDGVHWADLTDTQNPSIGGVSGNMVWENINTNLKKIRLKLTQTAGQGVVTVLFGAKAKGV